MLSLLHWKNKPVLTLLDSFIAFFPTKPCFFQEIYISTFVSTSKLWQFGIRCHDSIKATNVLVLPNPRDTENSKRVPLPTGSLELSPCPLWHHPLKLSSPFLALLPGHWSYLLSFHYRPFFCSPCKCLHSPKVNQQSFFFFNFHTFLLVSSNVHNLNYFPWHILPSGPLPHPYAPGTHLQDITQHSVGRSGCTLSTHWRLNEWMHALDLQNILNSARETNSWISKEEPGLHSISQ